MPNKPKILLAEDQQLIRESLKHLLKPRYNILATVSNGIHVLDFLEKSSEQPDLCILDIQMPELDGIECANHIRVLNPSMKIALLTSFNSLTHLEQGLLSNVNGYILKDTSFEGFDSAIQSLLQGHFVAPWTLMNSLSNRISHLIELEQRNNFEHTKNILSLSDSLDEKEIEIIRLIWIGWTNRMIADDLYISEGTAKNYVSRIYKKLKINNRSELMNLLGTPSK